MKRYQVLCSVTLALIAVVTLSTMDANDAELAQVTYEKRVCDGTHPDYKQWGVECDE